MLAPARVEVVRCGIRHVTSCVVRDNGDVIADLVLVRPAFERIKWDTYRDIRRPGKAAVGAVGIE